jgi:hypothetical protein
VILMKRILLFTLFLALFIAPVAAQDGQPAYYFTYHQADGNRLVGGHGFFPNVQTQDFVLESYPAWIVGVLVGDSPAWVTVGTNGMITGVAPPEAFVDQPFTVMPMSFGTSIPPLGAVLMDTNEIFAFESLGVGGSRLTHAVPLATGTFHFLYVTETGDVVWLGDSLSEYSRAAVNAIPDARIVVNGQNQAALYAGATDQRYTHGILGDTIEGTVLVVLVPGSDGLQLVSRVDLPGEEAFEGISPFWADVDGDGVEDLVTTVSSASAGAQIRVYRVDGSLLASGPAVGEGFRWRHQLAFGPFGPNGENELVAVLTPHIGGVVEFYRYENGALTVVASLDGYTSHVINTRNTDMAVGGDFNGDGQLEIVLPDQSMSRIAGLQRTADGVAEIWSLPLDGTLATNLAAVTLPDGELVLAAGTTDGRLRVWLPG